MPQSLRQHLAPAFPPHIRQRGERLFRSRRVDLVDFSDDALTLDVLGSRAYNVLLKLIGDDLHVSCECPYFDSDGPCKHLWAAVCFADDGEFLNGARDVGPGLVEYTPPGAFAAQQYRFLRPSPPPWRRALTELTPHQAYSSESRPVANWPANRELCYILDANAARREKALVINVQVRDPKKNGELSVPKAARWGRSDVQDIRDPLDRRILTHLYGAAVHQNYYSYGYDASTASTFNLEEPLASELVPSLCETGRFLFRPLGNAKTYYPLSLGDGEPWMPKLVFERKSEALFSLSAALARGQEQLPLHRLDLVGIGRWVIIDKRLSRIRGMVADEILAFFQTRISLDIPAGDIQRFLREFLVNPRLPELEMPEELAFEDIEEKPIPILSIEEENLGYGRQERLVATLLYEYGSTQFNSISKAESYYDAEARRLVRRDADAEVQLRNTVYEAGFRNLPDYLRSGAGEFEIAPARLPKAVRLLTSRGWNVELDGDIYRQAGDISFNVSTGIDWFDLDGSVDFGPTRAALPDLLKALGKGHETVKLEDGSHGLIPEDWAKKFGLLVATASTEEGAVRFRKNQAVLLDALLAAQPAVNVDAAFRKVRDELQSFQGIERAKQPAGFVGELRGYQCDGLAWLEFLRKLGLGGCLADDMGVGKTIQVLALFENLRQARNGNGAGARRPSLVVAPKSVLFNWIEETHRFTPQLRVLDYSGPGRSLDDAGDYDIVLTSYGLLRRDILKLEKQQFEYAILDEAQHIKNAKTAVAKAARLLKAEHRLALTGTPVENHLGELWSIFEYLNPGMLGASALWQTSSSAALNPDEETRATLRGALRPYILRRTKQQVASELPEKLEQTLFCEMEPKQRKLYDELRNHYRLSLLGRVESRGLNRSKMHILEALLRLRQAACHPGLIDKTRTAGPSAKIDALLPMIEEIVEEGHKALVFSQFTSFLSLLRKKLDKAKWRYEYLDGQTRDRKAPVDQFQNDPNCPLFLISLKAGGLGLNLTAADYVFLLDPWWNPAVEAQAVDRAHRIGQTRRVFAYRLIAKDTVEEKVLALQKTKRDLADSIITEDNSILRNIRREDLELLLS